MTIQEKIEHLKKITYQWETDEDMYSETMKTEIDIWQMGAIYTAIESMAKQIPKKPTIDEFDYGEGYVCGVCESFLHYVSDDDEHIRTNYCCHCGNKIDWSEEDE